jgi:hypothetical protein
MKRGVGVVFGGGGVAKSHPKEGFRLAPGSRSLSPLAACRCGKRERGQALVLGTPSAAIPEQACESRLWMSATGKLGVRKPLLYH